MNQYTGFAIALAWPETYCKQPGSWYDGLMNMLGVNKNNYYKAGHAALVLIHTVNKQCYYFDFGRYHSPFQHGRVRDEESDPELRILTEPTFSNDCSRLTNLPSILKELQKNQSCHGNGILHASYCPINFKSAYVNAKRMQEIGPIPYGPFVPGGSNCSRFVQKIILAGAPEKKYAIQLKYKIPFTPTPLSNIKSLHSEILEHPLTTQIIAPPKNKLNKLHQLSTLPKPIHPENIPQNAFWLSGEGAGSWYVLSKNNSILILQKYSPCGEFESESFFRDEIDHEDMNAWHITYPSDCRILTLSNGIKTLSLKNFIARQSVILSDIPAYNKVNACTI